MTVTNCKKTKMPGAEQTVVVMLDCGDCKAVYEASQIPRPVASHFRCELCDGIVHRWSGSYDYVQWKSFPKNWGGRCPSLATPA